MAVWIALLRGINVGGHNKIRMGELRRLFGDLGLSGARTLLQSGNIVFCSSETDPLGLSSVVERGIERRFGLSVPVVTRSQSQLENMIDGADFTAAQLAEPNRILIFFLRDEPTPGNIAALKKSHNGPERFRVVGGDLYVFYPDGVARSKFDNTLIDRRLDTIATARNWNTVGKLATLCKEIGCRGAGS